MDAFCLGDTVKYLSDAGSVTLNIDERLNVELALHELQAAYTFEHLFLWGKIQGNLINHIYAQLSYFQFCFFFLKVTGEKKRTNTR